MTKYLLRDPDFVDLAFNPRQPRDGRGRWSLVGSAMHAFSSSSSTETVIRRDKHGNVTRDTKVKAAKASLHFETGKKGVKSQLKVWQMQTEERAQILADLDDDPLPEVPDELLIERLQGDDKRMKAKALKSLEARRKRYEFLAETATNGLLTVKTKEAFSRWDARVEKVPGGKGLLRLRDRFLHEEKVISAKRKGSRLKELGKEFALHGAVGSALVALAAGAAGLLAMKYGGDYHHAQELVHHFLEGGPSLGTVPLPEIASFVAVQTAILKAAKAAKHIARRHKEKKAVEDEFGDEV